MRIINTERKKVVVTVLVTSANFAIICFRVITGNDIRNYFQNASENSITKQLVSHEWNGILRSRNETN